ncbi:hypothetical protein BAL199_13473 [alpha proteobacterium BAL199]|jgi:hypothetical protein|nr:hypothetical protein BAL199_13473 [alpha proteobacterium BAL199]
MRRVIDPTDAVSHNSDSCTMKLAILAIYNHDGYPSRQPVQRHRMKGHRAMSEVASPALSVGTVAGDTLGIFVQRVFRPALIVVVPLTLLGLPSTIARIQAAIDHHYPPAPSLLLVSLHALVYVLATGFLSAATYEAVCGRSIRTTELLADVVGRFVPLLICSVVLGVAVAIGIVLIVLPGIWIAAVWSAVVPVIVIEGAGFHAFARSAQLTRGYRLPIAGGLFVIGVAAALPPLIVTMLSPQRLIQAVGVPIFATVLEVLSVLCSCMALCGFAVIYARLREIENSTATTAEQPG